MEPESCTIVTSVWSVFVGQFLHFFPKQLRLRFPTANFEAKVLLGHQHGEPFPAADCVGDLWNLKISTCSFIYLLHVFIRHLGSMGAGPRTGVHLCLCHVVISKLETPQASWDAKVCPIFLFSKKMIEVKVWPYRHQLPVPGCFHEQRLRCGFFFCVVFSCYQEAVTKKLGSPSAVLVRQQLAPVAWLRDLPFYTWAESKCPKGAKKDVALWACGSCWQVCNFEDICMSFLDTACLCIYIYICVCASVTWWTCVTYEELCFNTLGPADVLNAVHLVDEVVWE